MNKLAQLLHLARPAVVTTPRAPTRLPVDLASVMEHSANREFRRLCEESFPRAIKS